MYFPTVFFLFSCATTDKSSSVDGLSDLEDEVVTLRETVAAQQVAIDALTDAVEEGVEARLTALEEDVSALESDGEVGETGESVWHADGAGSGACARANVTTTSDRPLYVFATVNATHTFSGGCSVTGLYACSGEPTPTYSASTEGTVTLIAENAEGAWTDSASTTAAMAGSFLPATTYTNTFGTEFYSGYASTSASWTVPLQAVFEIPAAGTYIIDLSVTTFSGACQLVVLQP